MASLYRSFNCFIPKILIKGKLLSGRQSLLRNQIFLFTANKSAREVMTPTVFLYSKKRLIFWDMSSNIQNIGLESC